MSVFYAVTVLRLQGLRDAMEGTVRLAGTPATDLMEAAQQRLVQAGRFAEDARNLRRER